MTSLSVMPPTDAWQDVEPHLVGESRVRASEIARLTPGHPLLPRLAVLVSPACTCRYRSSSETLEVLARLASRCFLAAVLGDLPGRRLVGDDHE